MFYKSSDNENENDYNTQTIMTQTSLKKKTKWLDYFNDRLKEPYNRIREST